MKEVDNINRAEARISKFKNSTSQIRATNDLCIKNSGGFYSFVSHMKSSTDESNLARQTGRKSKKK